MSFAITVCFLLFQSPTPAPTPAPPPIPERMPALFTLIYVGGLALILLLLLLSLLRSRRRPPGSAAIPKDLPKAVKKRLGSTSTNRGLRALRWLFILLAIGVFSFHVYWAEYAAEPNDKFQELSYKHLSVRRLVCTTVPDF